MLILYHNSIRVRPLRVLSIAITLLSCAVRHTEELDCVKQVIIQRLLIALTSENSLSILVTVGMEQSKKTMAQDKLLATK